MNPSLSGTNIAKYYKTCNNDDPDGEITRKAAKIWSWLVASTDELV
jgi:hypothetical protein